MAKAKTPYRIVWRPMAEADLDNIIDYIAQDNPTDAIGFDQETLKTMARIHARDAALKVACNGLQWTIGAGQTDPNLAQSLNLPGIYAAQAGLIEDMDAVAVKLAEAFPAE